MLNVSNPGGRKAATGASSVYRGRLVRENDMSLGLSYSARYHFQQSAVFPTDIFWFAGTLVPVY
jgi:hypothetical protein